MDTHALHAVKKYDRVLINRGLEVRMQSDKIVIVGFTLMTIIFFNCACIFKHKLKNIFKLRHILFFLRRYDTFNYHYKLIKLMDVKSLFSGI